MGLWKLVEERAALTPYKTMIVDDYERSITFVEFRNRAERVAQGLVNLGVKPGQTVAWQLPTRLETVLLLTALNRIDVRQVPILTLYREREVGFLLKETTPAFVFAPGGPARLRLCGNDGAPGARQRAIDTGSCRL